MSNTINAIVNVKTGRSKRNIKEFVKEINRMQNAVRQAGDQAGHLSRKIAQATDKVNRLATGNREVAKTAKKATAEYSKMHSVISKVGSKLKWLASVYLGVMGVRGMITASDVITSAKNKFNALDGGSPQQTEKAMNKMYAASQRARTGYADMMTNVSKSMTLAGGAFGGNIDNAIKFQEIMAKSYTVGGASAAEQASSMYQLVQALGSGVLQGDELRSVREGAAVAYKEIEKFAQGVYNTEESLKDLASQGKITSDIVVAAVMNAEQTINDKFNNSAMTFAQAWTTIKNTALYSFKPVLEMLNQALNSEFGKAVINGIGVALQIVAKALTTVFGLIAKVYNFVVDNWGVISRVLLTVGTLIGGWFAYQLSIALYTGIVLTASLIANFFRVGAVAAGAAVKSIISWIAVCPPLFLVIAILAAIVIAIIWVSDSFRDACGNIVGAVFWVLGVIHNVIAFIVNMALGLMNVLNAICTNIGIAFQNAWHAAAASFWEWVQDCLNGTGKIAKAVSKIAELFGLDPISIDTKVNSHRDKIKDYVSIEDAWKEGSSLAKYADLNKMFEKGYGIGTGAYDWGANKIEEFKEKLGLDGLGGGYDELLGTGSYSPSEALNGIKDNTGRMADAMDLAEEDLEYLRKIADMEWRKEFTTAEIKVDMSNYNTVNGDSDLDGIVTRLADKLYEELDMVANGVYA